MHHCPNPSCGDEATTHQKDGYLELYCPGCGYEGKIQNGLRPKREVPVRAGAPITSLAAKKREKQEKTKLKVSRDRGDYVPKRGCR